jgi:cytochrome c553
MLDASQYATCTANCHGAGGSAAVEMPTELSGTGGKHPIDGIIDPLSTVLDADRGTGDLFVDGWDTDSVAVCGDCHGTNGGGPRGPHGSSFGYILKGVDTTINTVTSGRSYGTPKNSTATSSNQQQAFCMNCHASDVYGFSNDGTVPSSASLGTAGDGHWADGANPRLRDRCMGNDGEGGRPGITGGPTGLLVSCTNCHAGAVWDYGAHSSTVPPTSAWSGTGFMNGNSWTQEPDANNCYASTGGNNGWSTCDQGNHN